MNDSTHASLTAYFAGHLSNAPVGFVVSTTDARYVHANAAYLQMCGLNWSAICGKSLIEDGAAMDCVARQKRLWLLEHVGRYHHERATLRHGTGLPISVIISAERVEMDGRPVDVEYFSLIRPASAGKTSSPLAPGKGDNGTKAQFLPQIRSSLSAMPEPEARSLMLSMTREVTRGLLLLMQTLPPTHPVSAFISRYAADHFTMGEGSGTEVDLARALSRLSKNESEFRLLDLATNIWVLARFQTGDIRTNLLSLVAPYTAPPDAIVNYRI